LNYLETAILASELIYQTTLAPQLFKQGVFDLSVVLKLVFADMAMVLPLRMGFQHAYQSSYQIEK
jgi:hypothetical protein